MKNLVKGFDYRSQAPVDLTGKQVAQMKRDTVAGGGKVKQLTTPQGKEVWLKDKDNRLAVEVYLS
jgi:hypothetical protein